MNPSRLLTCLALAAAATATAAPDAVAAKRTAVATTATATTATTPAPTPTVAPDPYLNPGRPFAATSFWNQPLAATAPLDPNSNALLGDLGRQFGLGTPWINTHEYSTPVYTVPRTQPTVRVALDNASVDPWLQAAWEQVPLPADAKPAAGTDGTAVVWQPGTDTMWEFWRLRKDATTGQWRAAYGGRMNNVSTNEGRYTQPAAWGASATSLPWLGGLMRLSELRAGKIDHALAMAIPQPRAGVWSWPAQRTDGTTQGENVLALGTRLRLNPAINIASLNLPPVTRMMAEAAQKYGIVIRDTADSVAFYAEDVPGNPYYGTGGVFGGLYPNQILSKFPWWGIQVLKTDYRTVPGQ